MRYTIRDLHSREKNPPRFCDVIIDDNSIVLETKSGKNVQRISFNDLVTQVEIAKELYR